MTVYYEIIMEPLQNGNNDEFLDKFFRYREMLSPEEHDRMFKLALETLPKEVVAKAWEDIKKKN